MDLTSIFLVSFTIALSGALAPGPLLAAALYQSGRHGPRTGPLVMLGHGLAEIAMVGLIVLGLSRLLDSALVFRTISWTGAAILICCGIDLLRRAKTASLVAAQGESRQRTNLALMGLVLSLANPYWSIWWLTVGAGLVLSARKAGLAGLTVFFVGHILADLGWYSFVSLSMSRGSRYLTDTLYRRILSVCAVLLIGFGVYFGLGAWGR